MSDRLLHVEELSAGYDGAAALRGLTLEVAPGEVVALMGANGAGKTTALRAISGAITPMGGSVTYAGQRIDGWSPQAIARAGLVVMSDRRSVFHGLTVAEHFRLHARGERLDAAEAYERFPALRDLRNRRAGLLSGGEQQMLGLARALARTPKLLLVDEFSLGLAPVIVQRLLPFVRDYATQAGAGVILVEQHVQLALEIADRGYVLSHGELVLARSAQELRHDQDLVIASYLGESAISSS
jgi:branched-chain amino acid transport system ATP-binding protein